MTFDHLNAYMASVCMLFVFLCLCVFVGGEVTSDRAPNSLDNHEEEITAVLNYLKSAPVKVYNYKRGTIVSANTKADITELTLDVSVDCINNYPELPCTEKILICNAFVRNSPDYGSRVLNDVKCVPKPEIVIEEAPYVSSTNPTELQANETKSIALSNEAVSSEVGEHFVAVRKDSLPCLGCPFDLSPNAEGIDELVDLALRHLETEKDKKQALVKVLRLQQQVVSGVKLILLAEIAPTTCSKDSQVSPETCPLDSDATSTVCEVIFLHKPWISQTKHVIKNNCTISQEYVKPDAKKTDINNEIDVNAGRTKPAFVDNPNFDHIAENGAVEDMTPSRLEDLESQILMEAVDYHVPSTAQSTLSAAENHQPLEDRPNIYNTEGTWIEPSHPPSSESTPSDFSSSSSSLSSSEEDSRSMDRPRRRRAIPQLEKISPEEKGLVKNLADFAASSLDSIDDDNHKRVILQILGAKKMVGDDGVYYRLIMRMGISQCLEDGPPEPNCRERLFENYTKICKVQVYVNDDIASPKVVKSQCQNIKRDKDNNSNRTNYSRFRRDLRHRYPELSRSKRDRRVGGPLSIDKNDPEAQQLVQEGLNHLNSRLSKNHQLVQILTASRQVVAGLLYRMSISVKPSETAAPVTCQLKVWTKSWENFKEFTVKCDGDDEKYVFTEDGRSKRSLNEYKSRYEIKEDQVLKGGVTPIDKNHPKVQQLVREGVNHLNTRLNKNYQLVKILTASDQVVAGKLYRMTIAIKSLEADSPVKCQLMVGERSWENYKEFIIKCDGDEEQYEFTEDARSKRSPDERQVLGDASELNSFGGTVSGGEFEVAKDDENVIRYLEDALDRLETESGHENKLKVDEILSVSKQIVSGHIYRIKANVVLSDCKRKASTPRAECQQLRGVEPKACDFVVFEKLWLPNSRQINVTCDDDDKEHFFRNKRSVRKSLLSAEDEALTHSVMFGEFVKKYNRTYSSKKEYKYRLKVFGENMQYVRLLNAYEQGTATYGVTAFADLTRNEFSKRLGLRPDLHNENEAPFASATIPDLELPTEFDWRAKGAVTEVKDQEQCGSCWAFSVTGNVEGQYAIKHNKLMEFSEQELVDCDTEDQGCNGGLMDNAYRAIEKMGGLETEQDYPYDAEDERCHFNKSLARVQLTGAVNISHNETDMAKWLVANGPISIAINANAMQFYMGGISHPFRFLCNPKNLDHGVLIVGYGVHNYPLFKKTLPYWIVKNSWGKSWGEQGYYRVYRGDGTCGLNQTPSSAIVA